MDTPTTTTAAERHEWAYAHGRSLPSGISGRKPFLAESRCSIKSDKVHIGRRSWWINVSSTGLTLETGVCVLNPVLFLDLILSFVFCLICSLISFRQHNYLVRFRQRNYLVRFRQHNYLVRFWVRVRQQNYLVRIWVRQQNYLVRFRVRQKALKANFSHVQALFR